MLCSWVIISLKESDQGNSVIVAEGETETFGYPEKPANRYLLFVRRFAYVLALSLIAYFSVLYKDILLEIVTYHWKVLLILSIASSCSLYIQAISFLCALQVKKADYLMTVKIWTLGGLLNYLGPFQPGLIAKAVYFRTLQPSWKKLGAAYLNWSICNLWVAAILAVICLYFAGLISGKLLLICLALVISAPFLTRLVSSNYLKRLPANFSRAIALFNVDLRICALHTFQFFTMAVCYFYVYNQFGLNLTPALALLMATLTTLASVIPIFPNGLGLLELANVTMASFLGAAPETIFLVSALFRTSHILLSVVNYLILDLLTKARSQKPLT